MKKFCVKCGKPFEAIGREVICPACKEHAAEDAKRAAVLRAKRASWTGESVPVRISGRASSVIRAYGAANNLPFAQALDELLKASDYFASTGKAWEDITPYKSRRRDKHATETETENTSTTETAQDVPQDVQAAGKPQDVQDAQEVKTVKQEVKTAAKVASKATTSKATSKAAAGKKGGKA